MVVAGESWAERRGVAPVARLVSYGIAAVEPGMFGLGPVPAIRQALDRAGWKLGIGALPKGLGWGAAITESAAAEGQQTISACPVR